MAGILKLGNCGAPFSLLVWGVRPISPTTCYMCGANSVTVATYLAPTSAADPEREMHRPGLYQLALYDR